MRLIHLDKLLDSFKLLLIFMLHRIFYKRLKPVHIKTSFCRIYLISFKEIKT